MCDHYDSYYRMTPAEEKEHEAAQKREAERVAAFRKKREDGLVADYSARFGVTPNQARKEIRKIQFVMEWR